MPEKSGGSGGPNGARLAFGGPGRREARLRRGSTGSDPHGRPEKGRSYMRFSEATLICSSSAMAVLMTGVAAPAFAADPAPQADDVVDAISSEDFGKLPDKNVADA